MWVTYHSDKWNEMVEQGWITAYVWLGSAWMVKK